MCVMAPIVLLQWRVYPNICTQTFAHNPLTNLCSQSFVRFHAAKSLCSFVDSLPNFQFPTHFPFSIICPLPLTQVFRRCFTGVSQVFHGCFAGIHLGTRTIHLGPRSNPSSRPFTKTFHSCRNLYKSPD